MSGRRPAVSLATITRAIKAVHAVGASVAEVRLEPDGTLRVFTAAAQAEALDDELEAWRAQRDGRRAKKPNSMDVLLGMTPKGPGPRKRRT